MSNKLIMRAEEPPARVRVVGNPTKIDKQVAIMRAHPGKWYKVREGAAGGAYRVYAQRGCETRTKTIDGKYDIWARVPGEDN